MPMVHLLRKLRKVIFKVVVDQQKIVYSNFLFYCYNFSWIWICLSNGISLRLTMLRVTFFSISFFFVPTNDQRQNCGATSTIHNWVQLSTDPSLEMSEHFQNIAGPYRFNVVNLGYTKDILGEHCFPTVSQDAQLSF